MRRRLRKPEVTGSIRYAPLLLAKPISAEAAANRPFLRINCVAPFDTPPVPRPGLYQPRPATCQLGRVGTFFELPSHPLFGPRSPRRSRRLVVCSNRPCLK
jgi:hypothetical protein